MILNLIFRFIYGIVVMVIIITLITVAISKVIETLNI